MKTPVLIPACNEELHIAATLESLPLDLVEPVVLVNGSDDRTTAIASRYEGVIVREYDQQGKLPSIQNYLCEMGERALEPLLILDGDARPVFPRGWHQSMVGHLYSVDNHDKPSAVGGPVWYTGPAHINNVVRSVKRTAVAALNAHFGTPTIRNINQCGPNMGLHLQNKKVLDGVLELPHYWEGEDRAMMYQVTVNDGELIQTVSPAALVITPLSLSFSSLRAIAKNGRRAELDEKLKRYRERGAPGSRPFKI